MPSRTPFQVSTKPPPERTAMPIGSTSDDSSASGSRRTFSYACAPCTNALVFGPENFLASAGLMAMPTSPAYSGWWLSNVS